ncbi:uncharacterized protein N7511_004413 [Penicillium nucicola]|uniref:uncharacterized protein n=1 Tax=Penicillium nucicola TaxID=1850975 RepID=UPI002545262D|nr:uncharacterized protein N7511_004413 [Penicillium nucicola]KAJ5766797.1 hypothetical protein N7511_004413 [Penicillium nucicola]
MDTLGEQIDSLALGNENVPPKGDAPSKLSGVDDPEEAARLGWTNPIPFDYAKPDRESRDWAGIAQRYEWDADYGEVGPPNEELEKQLFRGSLIQRVGDRLSDLNAYAVRIDSGTTIHPATKWEDAGLHPVVLENIALCQYNAPTAVQSYAVPAILAGHDLISVAQTGSGKTAAFLIPIISKLMGKTRKLAAPRPNTAEGFNAATDAVRAEPLVLIVCPTRELATQIFDEARRLCYRSMLRPCVVYGGAPSGLQREELQKGCDILIATPGRLLDFMRQTRILSLCRVRYTVIDEADELLQPDWEDDFRRIMSGGDINEDADHHYLMFSATFEKQPQKIAQEYLSDNYVRLRVGRAGSSHTNVTQHIIYADNDMKMRALYDLIVSMPPVRTLVFVNSRDQVDFVDDFLYNSGIPSTSIHSGRTQREREDAIRAFRTAKCPVMVATGVSARGLDVINVLHVINYDLPSARHGGINEYVHRIGRTARIGNEGLASSFYNDRNEDLATDLVKSLIECKQQVPDFLEGFRPEGDVLDFDDGSDDEAVEENGNNTITQAAADDDQSTSKSTQSHWKAAEDDDIWN